MEKILRLFNIFLYFAITAGLFMGCTNNDNADKIKISDTIQAKEETHTEDPEEPENPNETEAELYSYYPVFERIEKIIVGDGYNYEPEDEIIFILNDTERSELWRLMRIDEWVIATDLPAIGLYPTVIITEPAFQVWFFNLWDEEQILIIPSSPNPNNDEKVCYFAPLDILTDIITFTETLTPQ